MTYYTYLWLRVDGSPYYVGKGKGKRGFASAGHGVHCPKDSTRIITQDWLSEEQAFEAEIFLIAYYGRIDLGTGCLRNRTHGGEGCPGFHGAKSEEHRRLIGEAVKKFWASKVRIPWNKGQSSSQLSRAVKKSWLTRKRGEKRSKESCRRISEAAKKSWTPERRRESSKKFKGNQNFLNHKHRTETLDKMSISWTPERRAAQSKWTTEMNKKRWAKK